ERRQRRGDGAVSPGAKQGARKVGGAPEHAAETPERAACARRECRLDDGADALLDRIRAVDVDAGGGIVERLVVTHAERSSSNATRRLKSATRAAMSAGPISSSRWMENRSTAKEPMAEPYTTARRRLSSLRSPVRATYPMKPPAKESPAPVGSNTSSSG